MKLSVNKTIAIEGLYKIFYNPRDLFINLKRTPKVLIPTITFCIFSLVAIQLTIHLQFEHQLAFEKMRGFSNDMFPKEYLLFIMYLVKLTGLIGPLFVLGFAVFILGDDVKVNSLSWKQIFSIIIYSEIIYAVGLLLTSILIVLKRDILFTISLGPLLKNYINDTTFRVLSHFDLFLIWEILIVGLGFTILTNKPRYKTAFIVIGCPYLITLLF